MLPTVIPCDIVGRRFTLHQLVLRDDRGIRRPFVCAVHFHVPFGQVVDHFIPDPLVPQPACPVEQMPRVAVQRLPDPEFAPLFLEIMPHLIEFQDDRSPRGLWLLVVVFGTVPDPSEHSLRRDPEEERDAVHGHPAQVPQHSVDLQRMFTPQSMVQVP